MLVDQKESDSPSVAAMTGILRRPVLLYAFLTALTLLALGPIAWHHEFLAFDDPTYITKNPFVRNGLTHKDFVWAFTSRDKGFWIPMTWLSLQLDATVYGADTPEGFYLSPEGFYLTNLLLHLASVLLLFYALNRMTGAPIRSALAAAFFAVHPMRVESIAWATERKDVLAVFFWMVALAAYAHYASRPSIGRYLAVFIAMAYSLMSKSMGVTLPCVLLLLDIWPLRRLRFEEGSIMPVAAAQTSWLPPLRALGLLVLEKAPLLVMSITFGLLAFWTLGPGMSEQALPAWRRLLHVPIYYSWYITTVFMPYPLGMCYPFPAEEELWWRAPLGIMLLAAGSFAAWHWRRRQPALLIGWLWFLGTLVPVIGLNVADRFTYIPHIGIYLALVWGLADLAAYRRLPVWLLVGAPAFALCFFVVLTLIQGSYWGDGVTLWRHCVALNETAKAHHNLGHSLQEKDKLDEAVDHYRIALKLDEFDVDAHYNLGRALYFKGQMEKDSQKRAKFMGDAMAHYGRALALNPRYSDAYVNLGKILFDQGNVEGAATLFRKALEFEPDMTAAYCNLGMALLAKQMPNEAIEQFRLALRIDPKSLEGHYNLGLTLLGKGDLDGAIFEFREALKVKPDNALVSNNLGYALFVKNDFPAAAKYSRDALKFDRDLAPAHFNLGRALKAMHDPEAGLHLRKAAELYFNLGNALQEKGDLDGAIAQYRIVVEIEPNADGAYVNLGKALLGKGEFAESQKTVLRVLERLPIGHGSRALAEEILRACKSHLDRGS